MDGRVYEGVGCRMGRVGRGHVGGGFRMGTLGSCRRRMGR